MKNVRIFNLENRVFVLAFMCVIMCGMLLGQAFDKTTAKAASKMQKEAKKAYRTALEKDKIILDTDKFTVSNTFFGIVDINHDGVSELYIRDTSEQYFFTYREKAIKKLDDFSTGDMLVVHKKGNILSSGRYLHGHLFETIYQLSGGKLKKIVSADYNEEGVSEFRVKKKKTSKKKYEKYIKKISKHSKTQEIDSYNITPKNLKKYLS